jgi:hypothetical protein
MLWNLALPVAMLAACGPQVADQQGDTTDATTDGEMAEGPECVEQSDCPGGYACVDGHCEYQCSECCGAQATAGDQFRCGYDYYECYSDSDCNDGKVCVDAILALQFAQLAADGPPALIGVQGERIVRGDPEAFVELLDIDATIVDVVAADLDGDVDLDLALTDGTRVVLMRGQW